MAKDLMQCQEKPIKLYIWGEVVRGTERRDGGKITGNLGLLRGRG